MHFVSVGSNPAGVVPFVLFISEYLMLVVVARNIFFVESTVGVGGGRVGGKATRGGWDGNAVHK